MRKLIGLAAAGAALVLAMPAHAADGLRCVGDQLGKDFAMTQADRIATALIGGADDLPPLPEPTLLKAVDTCATRYTWNAQARDLATVLTRVSILQEAIGRTLRAEKVDLAQVQGIYDGLPESARRGFIDPDKMKDASVIVAQRLTASGINTEGKRAEHIGMYLGALAAIEFFTPMFASA